MIIVGTGSVYGDVVDVRAVRHPACPRSLRDSAVGPVLSSMIVSAEALAVRPASLVHEPLNACPAVSVVWKWSTVQVGGPLTDSVPKMWTVTSLVYHRSRPHCPR